MPIVVGRADYERTLLDCVQRVVSGIGESAPSSVGVTSPVVRKAVDAVNDAYQDVYVAAQWDFRFAWEATDLEDDTMWYDLPDGFGEMATDIPVYLGTAQLEYLDFRKLLERYPDFRLFPTSAGVNLSVIVQSATNTNHFGSPLVYTVTKNLIGLFPAPNEDYVSTQSQFVYAYYNLPADLISDGDIVELPKNLWSAHYYLALSYLKQYVEQRDFAPDEQRGLYRLNKEVARRSKRHRQTIIPKQDIQR